MAPSLPALLVPLGVWPGSTLFVWVWGIEVEVEGASFPSGGRMDNGDVRAGVFIVLRINADTGY